MTIEISEGWLTVFAVAGVLLALTQGFATYTNWKVFKARQEYNKARFELQKQAQQNIGAGEWCNANGQTLDDLIRDVMKGKAPETD